MANLFYQERLARLYQGDCRRMNELPDESIQCAVTSPPYWGLRKYEGNQDLIWGGDKDCEHEWGSELVSDTRHPDFKNWEHKAEKGVPNLAPHIKVSQGNFCSLCGAWKGAFGLEPTPELYVQHTVEIMREIWRVLRKDGVVFWDIGDSYASGKGTCFNPGGGKGSFSGHGDRKDAGAYPLDRGNVSMLKASGLKQKDLCLIPFRVAIALQEDGWWVRSVIIWNKPNPMPESVTDRPTNAHEFILMLTKSGTNKYWTHRDKCGTRIRPEADYRWIKQVNNIRGLKTKGVQEVSAPEQLHGKDTAPQNIIEEVDIKPEGWMTKNKMGWDRINLWQGHDYYWDADAVREEYSPTVRWGGDKYKGAVKQYPNGEDAGLARERSCYPHTGRNLRDVWTFPAAQFPDAHFAVFPEKLPELCIKAATSEKGCCPKCGAPWGRIVDRKVEGELKDRPYCGSGQLRSNGTAGGQGIQHSSLGQQDKITRQTTCWQPTCSCGLEPIPCTVLDPFAGAGTTMLSAKKLGRNSIGYEISERYCPMIESRVKAVML